MSNDAFSYFPPSRCVLLRWFLPLLLLAPLVQPGAAMEFGPVDVSEVPLAKIQVEPTVHGYIEYRFRVANRDKQRAHRVSITLPAHRIGAGGLSGLALTSNSVEVPPDQTAILSILQPPVPLVGGSGEVRVYVDNRVQEVTLPCNVVLQHCSERYGSSSNTGAHILTGVRITPDIRDVLAKGTKPASSTTSTTSASPYGVPTTPTDPQVAVWEAEAAVGEWSPNWLAYTRFDGIALTSGEIRELQEQYPELFAAVRRYVEAGGLLYVVGTGWTPPKEWSKDGHRGNEHCDIYDATLGVAYLTESDLPAVRRGIETVRSALFTRAASWSTAMQSAGWSPHHGGTSMSAGVLGGSDDLLSSLPVIANFGVPVKTIMVLILVFAILIGPVNIGVLTLMKRRIWLLWTVPATSIIASLFVYGADYLREGFLKQTASRSITVLDQRRQEAVTFGMVGFYSTFTPGRGLTFDPATEVSCAYDRSMGVNTNRRFDLDVLPGGAQQFSNGWVRARLPSYFAVRKAEPMRKERLEFNWTDSAGPTVVNGLGVAIETLFVVAPDGKTYTASGIEPGAKSRLTADASAAPGTTPPTLALSSRYLNIRNWPAAVELDKTILSPGSYGAKIGGDGANPFLEKPLDSAKSYQHASVIYGMY